MANEKVKAGDLVKSLCAKEGISVKYLGEKIGMTQGNINAKVNGNGNMTINSLGTLLDGLGEDVTLVVKNGNKYTLDTSK